MKKRVHEFEKEQGGTRRAWREEREMRNDALILLSQKIKERQ